MLLHKSVEFDSRVRREASALAAAGHDVTVVELADVPAGHERLDGFSRVSVLPPAWVRRTPFALYRALFAWSFARAIVRLRPDVIHAHDAAMLIPGVIGRRLTGARLVYDSHELASSVPYRERHWAELVIGIERVALPRCAAVITVSGGIARRMRELYRLPVEPVVLRNVTDASLTGEAGHGTPSLRARLGLTATVPLILHQGAPAPGRGCAALVRALAELPDAHLVFLGTPMDGYGAEIGESAMQAGTAGRVHTLPSVPLYGLLSETAEADVGVTLLEATCENHRLALPNKLFEYIAAGVPVVGSDFPEIGGLIREYALGAVADPDDPSSVARAIAHVLEAPPSSDALARAREELQWSRERTGLLRLYDALASS